MLDTPQYAAASGAATSRLTSSLVEGSTNTTLVVASGPTPAGTTVDPSTPATTRIKPSAPNGATSARLAASRDSSVCRPGPSPASQIGIGTENRSPARTPTPSAVASN